MESEETARIVAKTRCLQCGDKGITNAFVFCVRCRKYAVHRYCLDKIPETCDEFVHFYCDGCEAKRKTKPVAVKDNVISCDTEVCKVSERINGVSGVAKEKSGFVVVKTGPQICKDSLRQSCDFSPQPDSVGHTQSNKRSPIDVREMNDKHEEMKEQPNSSVQLEEENKFASSSDEISLRDPANGKRSASKTSVEKDHNRLVNDATDCTVPAKVKKSVDTLVKCSPSDDISLTEMVNKKSSAILECSVEKERNKLVEDVKDSTLPSEVKKSRKRDRISLSRETPETDSGTDQRMREPSIVSCNESLRSSKKMKPTTSSEASLEKQRQGTATAQILSENKVSDLKFQCFDLGTEGRGIGPVNSRCGNKTEFREEKSGPHHVNNLLEQVPEDSTLVPVFDSHTRPVPIIKAVWKGSFNILHEKHDILDGLMAHLSTSACEIVHEEACRLQPVLHLEMLPKSDIWPKTFMKTKPSAQNIALYFFPSSTSEWFFDSLVDKMRQEELGMRAIVHSAELLVFPSNELPLGYWTFQNKYYLWGVFRGKRPPPSHSQLDVEELGGTTGIPADNKPLTANTKNFDLRSPRSPLSNSGSNFSGNT